MEPFEFDVEIVAEPQRVSSAFWNLEDWPAIAPHVRAIEMLYCDDNVQVLTMQVATKGRLDRFKSVRIRQGDTIFYFQPDPPPILRRHHGSWRMAAAPSGTIVTSRHFVDIDTDAAALFLHEIGVEAPDADSRRQQILELIRNNSLQTMLAVKKRLEQSKGGTYAPEKRGAGAVA